MIFKIQADVTQEKCLIYDKNRSYLGESPMTLALEIILGGRAKCYVKGEVDSKGVLIIEKQLKDRKW